MESPCCSIVDDDAYPCCCCSNRPGICLGTPIIFFCVWVTMEEQMKMPAGLVAHDMLWF
ncbi:hypothetical protein BDB00DRAFT_837534 [Zychaea mexicana]|uniref:uncharacterized protein n=1 Tax=Zychaea mexicana TaxID=64656 RepID=UPI0022FDC09D|nr:uncharacterized protein BDB00DRAFT_837534 [Zychaea mexicana]KAI9490529.1 hypothetical protein BDB00DRAFT_837534 [Zychaea mexicana]